MSKVPFADAICLSCHGKGKGCVTCNGVGTVGYKRSHSLWGSAYPKGYGGEVPHIPADDGHKGKRSKPVKSPKISITEVSEVPEPSEAGIEYHASGDVTIRPPAADASGRSDGGGN